MNKNQNIKSYSQLNQTKFHFVGIGGIGMCGLAELLHNMGAKVSGSDLSENVNTERLKKMGINVFVGHKAEHLGDANVLVYSSAVPNNNPEVAEARAKKIPLIPRAEALAEIMRLKRGIAVAGTHGKTTTTSLISAIFLEAKLNPTIVVGGRLDLIKSTAHLGDGEWLIAEADESDGSFNKLSPEIAVITNVDADHLDHYKSFENLQKAFAAFANKIPFYGLCVACGDDDILKNILNNFTKRVLFYGFSEENDYFLKGSHSKYQVYFNDKPAGKKQLLGEFQLQVPGKHNALNALAGIVVGMSQGLTFEVCSQGLYRFQGVDRRFHFKGEKNNVKVYDDYGHHPTEVRAVLEAFKEKYPNRRIVVYFQPHRFSRTQQCWHDFTTCFSLADLVLMADIYPAGEAPITGITSERLVKELKHSNSLYLPKDSDVLNRILSSLKPNDVFVTLGAGDGWKLGLKVLEAL